MFTIVPGATLTEFDIAPAGQYLLCTPRGRFMLSRSTADLIHSLDGRSDLEHLGKSAAELETITDFLRKQILPTGVFGDVDELGEAAAPSSPAEPRRSSLAYGTRPLFALTRVSRSTELLKHLYQPRLLVGLVALSVVAHALFFASQWGLRLEYFSAQAYALGGLLTFLTLPFHELGHGAACRHYRTRHGDMGFALYYVFPRFYTDTSETWKLRRWQRVVVDLGGVYFQLLAGAAFALLYLATGQGAWGTAVWMVDLSILYNLKPYLRVDGYWILTDIAGIPQPYLRVKEYLGHLFAARGGRRGPAPLLSQLPRWLRWFVLGYVVTIAALSAWVISIFVWKTVTLAMPSYPGVLSQLVRGPYPSGVLPLVLKALGQTVLIGAFFIFVWEQARVLWRWLRRRSAGGHAPLSFGRSR